MGGIMHKFQARRRIQVGKQIAEPGDWVVEDEHGKRVEKVEPPGDITQDQLDSLNEDPEEYPDEEENGDL